MNARRLWTTIGPLLVAIMAGCPNVPSSPVGVAWHFQPPVPRIEAAPPAPDAPGTKADVAPAGAGTAGQAAAETGAVGVAENGAGLVAEAGTNVPLSGPDAINGRVDWGDGGRTIQAGIADIATRATVQLIDLTDQRTVASVTSDEQGRFSLARIGIPAANHEYVLEAVKGLGNHAAGKDAVRLRTPIEFRAGQWTTPGTTGILINTSTTTLAIALSHRAGTKRPLTVTELLPTLQIGAPQETPLPPTPDSFTSPKSGYLTLEEFHTLWGMVAEALAGDRDPVATILSVTDGGGVPVGFRFVSEPHAVTRAEPEIAEAGDVITIEGRNFDDKNPTGNQVRIGGNLAETVSATRTALKIKVPPEVRSGYLGVQLGNLIAMGPWLKIRPVIDGVTPKDGATTGETIAVVGAGFPPETALFLGGRPLASTVESAAKVVGTLPADAQTGALVLGTSELNVELGTYSILPKILTTSPDRGTAGTKITLAGTGFHPFDANASKIMLGETPGVPIAWDNTKIEFYAPDNAVSGAIEIKTAYGSGSSSPFLVLPAISAVNPVGGKIGSELTIDGTGFHALVPQSRVSFKGTVQTSFADWTNRAIRLLVPAGALSGDVAVSTAFGSSAPVKVVVYPTLESITPEATETGAVVVLKGSGFDPVDLQTSKVLFGGIVSADIRLWNPTEIQAVLPDNAKSGRVTVFSGAPGNPSSPEAIDIAVLPRITGVTPSSATAGTKLTVVGSGFDPQDPSKSQVLIGGVPVSATDILSWTLQKIEVTVPSSAKSGQITVKTGAPGNPESNGRPFTMLPTLSQVSPAKSETGKVVKLSGAGFDAFDAGTSQVFFNGLAATPSDSDWGVATIWIKVPDGATSGNVTVRTAAAGTPTSGGYPFTVLPTIKSVTPASGAPTGATLTIAGTGFHSLGTASSVTFNGLKGTLVSWSNQAIQVKIPVNATTGPIVVRTEAPGSPVTPDFPYKIHPQVGTFAPDPIRPGAALTIDGSGFHGLGPASRVDFPGAAVTSFVPATTWTNNQINLKVPEDAVSGNVLVSTEFGQSAPKALKILPRVDAVNSGSSPPTYASTGQTVTVTGAAFTSSGSVSLGGVAAAGYPAGGWSNKSVKAIVSASANTGAVKVTTAAGDSALTVTLYILPTITGVSPSSGLAGDGTNYVTLTGTGFHGYSAADSKVSFGTLAASAFPVGGWANNTIKVYIPADAETSKIKVQTRYGSHTFATAFTIKPRLDSLTSTAAVGSTITLGGTGFHGYSATKSKVTFASASGTITGTPTRWDNRGIDVPVPSGAVSGQVTVTTEFGTSNALNLTVTPRLDALDKSSAATGATVRLTGEAFGATRGTSLVYFNGVAAASYPSWANGTIDVVVPPGATTGPVTVSTASGTSGGKTLNITPSITSFSPTSGLAGDGTNYVTISGTAFHAFSSANSKVFFGSTGATVFAAGGWTNDTIKVYIPADAQTSQIKVQTQYGSFLTAGNFTVKPRLDSLTGTAKVGDTVTLTGTGFHGYSAASSKISFTGLSGAVYAGMFPAPGWGNRTIAAQVPSGAVSGPVTVTTAAGTSNSLALVVPPRITSLDASTLSTGQTLTISGESFGASRGTSTVKFNGVAAGTYSSWGNTSIKATVPAGATTGDVTVTTADGTSAGVALNIAPTLTGVSPTSGLAGDGTNYVTLTGSGFHAFSSTKSKVYFGSTQAAAFVSPGGWANDTIKVYIPSGAQTSRIKVETQYGSHTYGSDFTVKPRLDSIPSSADRGGTITLGGTGFHGYRATKSKVTFTGSSGAVDGTPTAWSNLSIDVPVPTSAIAGSVTVSTEFGTSNALALKVPPRIDSLGVSSGTPGTSVTITGIGFGSFVSGTSKVKFNGTDAGVTSGNWSATSITATVPSGSTTGNVTVESPAGTSNGVSFTVVTAPVLTSLGSTRVSTGTRVTLNGSRFGSSRGSSVVYFNGVAASGYGIWRDDKIEADVPSTATTGGVYVTTSAGTSGSKTLEISPKISSMTSSQYIGSTIDISGSGFGNSRGASSVSFAGGVSGVTYTVWNTTKITVTVPSGAKSGTVTVTTGYGSATANLSIMPKVSSISPTVGYRGNWLYLYGTGFDDYNSTYSRVYFPGYGYAAPPSSSYWSPTLVRLYIPSSAVTGGVFVRNGASQNSGSTTLTIPGIYNGSWYRSGYRYYFTINGSYFGTSRPTVYVEYQYRSRWYNWYTTSIQSYGDTQIRSNVYTSYLYSRNYPLRLRASTSRGTYYSGTFYTYLRSSGSF